MRHPSADGRDVVDTATALLTRPGLVVVAGPPGCGRSTVLARLGAAFRGPVFAGGGLAMLRTVPAVALARAVRVRLPGHDTALLAEAVRSRVRGGLLLLDDLHHADPATLAALPGIAAHCRVAVALRTPHRLPDEPALRRAATGWLIVPPLSADDAAALARRVAPHLPARAVAEVVGRAGGVPLAVEALARHAGAGRGTGGAGDGVDRVAYAVAAALADLTRPARTAMAALGLLARPAGAGLLGTGVAELHAAGLVTVDPGGPVAAGEADGRQNPAGTGGPAEAVDAAGTVAAVSPYVAEVAAGLLDPAARRDLHRRLAGLVPAGEAARHLAAAGDVAAAYRTAVAAADTATTGGRRTELLLLACTLPGVEPDPRVRVAAAEAALAAGRPRAAARAVTAAAPLGVHAAVLRGEALLQAGDVAGARAAVAAVPDAAPPAVLSARDRVLLLAELATDLDAATETAGKMLARHGDPPAHAGLRAALAAVRAAARAPGWEPALATAAAAAGAAGDALAARWSAWLLVETLAADGRLAEAADTAEHAAAACAADLAYSWQTRFVAARLWCTALRGGTGADGAAAVDEVLRRAGDLTDRTLPTPARHYATAAASLVQADGALLAPARARLRAATGDGAGTPLLDWVSREVAWLDGQPEQAVAPAVGPAPPLLDGLYRITACWAAFDGAPGGPPRAVPGPPVVARTLAAWASGAGFADAAEAWRAVAVREQVRCLLAAGLHDRDPARAVPPLLAAEQLATGAGLVVLSGRARRALRRHAVRRDSRGPRSGTALTERERAVLRLVAAGEPTRRIAGQLGISGETVETHIRSGMRKLGARTRTEAAALAAEELR